MAWIYLSFACIFEIGWPIGFKIANNVEYKIYGIIIAVISLTLSGLFLFLAQKSIPIGLAYSIWTGVGTAGTFLIGVIIFKDPAFLIHYCAIGLIVSGVILLKLSSD